MKTIIGAILVAVTTTSIWAQDITGTWRYIDDKTGEPKGLVFPANRTILSLALGRQNVVHVAITDRAAAARASATVPAGAGQRLLAARGAQPLH